jgi:hypothetical protein
MQGWASQAGLMPVPMAQAAPPPTAQAQAHEYPVAVCGTPSASPADPDPNPVYKVEVSYNPDTRVWQIFHYRMDGSVVSRAQQYAIVDNSSEGVARWEGDLLRNPTLHMVGTVDPNGYYEERIWNKTLGRWVVHIGAQCALQKQIQAAPPAQPQVQLAVPPGTQIQQTPSYAPTYTTSYVQPAPAPAPAPAAPAPAAGGNTIIVVPR